MHHHHRGMCNNSDAIHNDLLSIPHVISHHLDNIVRKEPDVSSTRTMFFGLEAVAATYQHRNRTSYWAAHDGSIHNDLLSIPHVSSHHLDNIVYLQVEYRCCCNARLL